MPTATPAPALGYLSKLAIGAAAPTDKPLDYESETLGLQESFIDPQGLRGTRSHAAARVRANNRLISGDIVLGTPTPIELSYILPYIMGGSASSSGSGFNYPLTETLPAFFTDLLRGTTLFRYIGCRVSRAQFSSSKGTGLRVVLSVLGVDETTPGGAFPTLTLANDQILIWEDTNLAVSINGTIIDCFDWTLIVDNAVQIRQVNSQTATVVYTTDRIVTQTFTVPWGDAESLYGLAQGGVPTSITFTNGATSFSITAPKFQAPRKSPDVTSRDEIRNIISGVCRYSAAPNDEIVAFLDAT